MKELNSAIGNVCIKVHTWLNQSAMLFIAREQRTGWYVTAFERK